MRGIINRAVRDPKRSCFPKAKSRRSFAPRSMIVDEGIAEPILLGTARNYRAHCEREARLARRYRDRRSGDVARSATSTLTTCGSAASEKDSATAKRTSFSSTGIISDQYGCLWRCGRARLGRGHALPGDHPSRASGHRRRIRRPRSSAASTCSSSRSTLSFAETRRSTSIRRPSSWHRSPIRPAGSFARSASRQRSRCCRSPTSDRYVIRKRRKLRERSRF